MNNAVMWSHGFWKKPWICPEWRSIVRIRSIPADSSIRATSRAVIGSRGADFLSWREYPYHGVTAITRCAEPPTAASTIASSSISASFVVRPVSGLAHVGWTMNTSAPRTDSSYRQ